MSASQRNLVVYIFWSVEIQKWLGKKKSVKNDITYSILILNIFVERFLDFHTSSVDLNLSCFSNVDLRMSNCEIHFHTLFLCSVFAQYFFPLGFLCSDIMHQRVQVCFQQGLGVFGGMVTEIVSKKGIRGLQPSKLPSWTRYCYDHHIIFFCKVKPLVVVLLWPAFKERLNELIKTCFVCSVCVCELHFLFQALILYQQN